MNTIITGRTNPNVRHTIRGIYLCEKLNKHLLWKKKADIIYWIIIIIIRMLFPSDAIIMTSSTSAFI